MKKLLYIIAIVGFLGACGGEQKNNPNNEPGMENNENPTINESDTMKTDDNTDAGNE